jgi:hypothetical protein
MEHLLAGHRVDPREYPQSAGWHSGWHGRLALSEQNHWGRLEQ